MDYLKLSDNLLLISFFIYLIASIVFTVAITGKRWANRDPELHTKRYGSIGFIITVVGFLSQLGYVVTRWIGGGHSPTSNMFEFMAFLSFTIIFAFLVLYAIYRLPVLGLFAVPLGLIMLAYASVFPREVTPLIPPLQSYWLKIHVTTAALGEGILSIGFAAGLIYLVRTVDQKVKSKSTFWLEFVLSTVLMLIGFIIIVSIYAGLDQKTSFEFPQYKDGQVQSTQNVDYVLPAIVAPYDSKITKQGPMTPLFEAPSWMEGKDAARKLNTLIWSIITGLILYGLLRLILRKRLAAAMQPWLEDIDPDLIDEISYRAIAIGYPVYTLGALVFAMIWAAEAWGRFWGWDPKEVWALIVWLFYSAYLHLRLSRGWLGTKSAWMSVIGFVIILITLVVVNLVIAGLHSYAGV
ncbi:cytochrome c biogenesis protein CcsA [Brevibacillus massiliensis]|uniref:cytochrome c biogenesis protein CcsA n=1 Tax=Brevibacillus massiliensis TaxID=1118054 RepID=UPI0002FC147E|nr:cytochrome c biogenesis protein CcsA [Brevibacillus massiliensis]